MTHGDKAKAKTGKISQASAKKVSSKAVAQTSGKGGQADKAAGEKAAPVSKKGGGSVKAVPVSAASDAKGKSRASASTPPSSGDGSGFSNAVVGAAFKRALKKYPNALRKLTD